MENNTDILNIPNSDLSYKDFYNIPLPKFYEYTVSIMGDFNFSFHRTIKESHDFRRVELWKHIRNESDYAMIWVEILKGDITVPKDLPADVLRTMNESNMTKLFFFTNGDIEQSEKELIDDKNHFIFTPKEIIENISVIKQKVESLKPVIKRKNVKTPSGFTLIKNFLKSNRPKEIKTHVKIDLISDLVIKLIKKTELPFRFINEIQDFDDIPNDVREKLKKIQFALLTDLINTASLDFDPLFMWVRDELFYMFRNLIIYIGTVIEYESVEEMEKYKIDFDKNIEKLNKAEEQVIEYKNAQIEEAERHLIDLKKISINIIVVCIIIFIIIFFLK